MAESSPSKTRPSAMYHPYGRNKSPPNKLAFGSRPLTLTKIINEDIDNSPPAHHFSFSGGSSSLFPTSPKAHRPAMSEVSNLLKKNLIKNPAQLPTTKKLEDSSKLIENSDVGVIGGHRKTKKPPSLGFIPIENSFKIIGVPDKGNEGMGRATSFTLMSKPQAEWDAPKKIQHNWPILNHNAITGKSFFPRKMTSFSIYKDENTGMEISTTMKEFSKNTSQSFGDFNDSMDISFDNRHLSYRAPLHELSFRSDVSVLSDSGVSAMSEAEAPTLEDENSNLENANTSINSSLSKDLARMAVPSPLLFSEVETEIEKLQEGEKENKTSGTEQHIPSNLLPPCIARLFAPKCNEGKLNFSTGGILCERKNPFYDFPEYCSDILNYWLAYEKRSRPRKWYMSKQQEISHRMRGILVDWIVEVGLEYNMHEETIFLAVSCVDRFLSKMSVARNKLQLIGTAALFICSKYEEIQPPSIAEFVYITDETYTKEQVLQMELIMLNILSYDLMVPTAYDFVRSFSAILRLDSQTTCLAMYLTELALMDGERYLHFLPSVVATAAIALSRYTFQSVFWDDKIMTLTTHSFHDVQRCSQHLFNSFYDAPTNLQTAIYDKYKSVRYCSISQTILPATMP